jgi:diacylglycerol kinase family enzyme
MAKATKDDIETPDSRISVTDPDGVVHDEIGVLLASNNPYWFIGAPDFAGRARLDTGNLGVILADRSQSGDLDLKHADAKRWNAPKVTVDSSSKKVHVGIDGSLHKMGSPVDIHIDHKALRVVLPTELVTRELGESSAPDHDALSALSGPSS